MLASIGDITESVAYQEIFAEGKVVGVIKGKVLGEIKGQIRLLGKLHIDGLIDRDYYEKTVGPLKEQLRKLGED